MKLLLLSLIATFTLSPTFHTNGSDSAAATPLVLTDEQQKQVFRLKYKAWNMACELTPETCLGFAAPEIKYEKMRGGLMGYYDGTNTIFINIDLSGDRQMATAIHETIHYIHFMNELVDVPAYFANPGSIEKLCWSENQAFTLTDIWLEANGSRPVGPNWWKPYWHCAPYYDPEWELWQWIIDMPTQ